MSIPILVSIQKGEEKDKVKGLVDKTQILDFYRREIIYARSCSKNKASRWCY